MAPDPVAKLVPRIPRVTTVQLDQTDQLVEQTLHQLLYQIEGGRGSDHVTIDRLPTLIVAWNRCSEHERTRFIRLLGDTVEGYLRERSEQARRLHLGRRVNSNSNPNSLPE